MFPWTQVSAWAPEAVLPGVLMSQHRQSEGHTHGCTGAKGRGGRRWGYLAPRGWGHLLGVRVSEHEHGLPSCGGRRRLRGARQEVAGRWVRGPMGAAVLQAS